MNSKNSISTLLSQLMALTNNAVESVGKVNEAITSDAESVTIKFEKSDGSSQTYTIPSFGWIKNTIERLDNNIDSLTNIDGGGSTIRLSDGTYRKLMMSKLPSEAPSITQMNSINSFSIKSNYFFENMMNPLLCVQANLSGQISPDTERVIVQRYLLDTDTQTKIDLFNAELKNKNDIDYSVFLNTLVSNGISYVLDEETVNLPPVAKRYIGKFSVLKISDGSYTQTVNGVTSQVSRKLIKLDKLYYTDTESGYENTMQLAVGDSLEVNKEPVDTRYIIKSIDSSTNTVILELVEGFEPVRIGLDYFRIHSEKSNKVEVDITVGFNERCVVFTKAIDPDSRIPASKWSPGTGFYTNELTFTDSSGVTQTLQQYYQRYVIDFGAFLLSYANDWYPSSSEGVTPEVPVLNPDNFEIIQINTQITDSPEISQIRNLDAEKSSLSVTISAQNTEIQSLKAKIQSTNYATPALKNADITTLQNKISEYSRNISDFNGKVNTISALSRSSSLASISPKYRVRGFWNMPNERSTDATGPQSIIKFKIRYRYLSPDGSANPVSQIGEDLNGSFSNYNVVESVLRGRHKNANGVFVWDTIDNTNADSIDINQLDIPITKGEMVEIQVKSVSEAGFPGNPLESDWSEPVIISFPEELSQNSVVEDILNRNNSDESQMIISQTLNTLGVMNHISDSFTSNSTNFVHTAMNISSGFVSDDETPITLYNKIAEMQTMINQLLDVIGTAMGEMQVTVSDEFGNSYQLVKDSMTKINAGNYVAEASKLAIQKGAIITKNFYINISNTEQTGLRLLSKFWGNRTVMVKESMNYAASSQGNTHTHNGKSYYPNTGTYLEDDNDYNSYYKYDLVPINLYSPDSSEVDGIVINNNMYQSAQCRNQFINVRYNNISGDTVLYIDETRHDEGIFINEYLLNAEGIATADFIWDFNNNTGGGHEPGENGIAVHTDCPLTNTDEWIARINQIFPEYEIQNYNPELNKYLFRLPKTAEHTITNNLLGKNTIKKAKTSVAANKKEKINIQIPYELKIETQNFGSESVDIAMTHKIGYDENDQYLIGKNSCTSYLFLNPQKHSFIQVDGDSRNSSTVITGGSSISIPLTFQYRMTDYYGQGSSGIGRILGNSNVSTVNKSNLTNIYMSNIIGIDIWNDRNTPSSYDIQIFATYGSTANALSPSAMVQYNTATMQNAVNSSNSPRKPKRGNINVDVVVPNKNRR